MASNSFLLCCALSALLVRTVSGTSLVKDAIVDLEWDFGKLNEVSCNRFDKTIARYDLVLVEFYASWCQHCQKLALELEKVAYHLQDHEPRIAFAKVNAGNTSLFALKHGIRDFPTLRLYKSGHALPLKQWLYSADAITAQLTKTIAPNVTLLSTGTEVAKFLETSTRGSLYVTFLGFGIQLEDLAPVATKYHDQAWWAVVPNFTQSEMVEFDFDKAPAIIAVHGQRIYRELEVFYGSPVDEDFEQFARMNFLPLMVSMDEDSFPRIVASGRPIVLVVADFDGHPPKSVVLPTLSVKDTDDFSSGVKLLTKLRSVAHLHRRYVFAYVDASSYQSFLFSFGISSGVLLPRVIVWDGSVGVIHMQQPELLRGDDPDIVVHHFLQDVGSGKLKAENVKQLPWHQRAYDALHHPNFPIVLAIIAFAVIMKLKQGGRNIILPLLRNEEGPRRNKHQRIETEVKEVGEQPKASVDLVSKKNN